jgi:hypothetical protein
MPQTQHVTQFARQNGLEVILPCADRRRFGAGVLELLGADPTQRRRGGHYHGPCPLHGSSAATSRWFSADLEQHIFHCFKCGRSGNGLDFWAQATQQSAYDAAIDL